MKLLLSESAKKAYSLYKSDDPELADKIKSVLRDTLLHPTEGVGAPKKLEGRFIGFWQRTFSPGEIVVYSFDAKRLKIASIGRTESALKSINLEAYSKDDEASVMSQMSANRGKSFR